jgi:alcohol dehydrogenase YqhD (iron-dependent ADH family)
MLGNFSYCNPTKLYFGDDSLNYLHDELKKYGENVLLVYGGGSIKKNGIYDEVTSILKEEGKNTAEVSGVMPNPTIQKLREGIRTSREHKTDLILAVGGGSVIDYAKAVSVSVNCQEDPWEKYFIRFEEPDCITLPVGAVLTMVGTGSEMNAGSVITNPEKKLKIGHVFADEKNHAEILHPEPEVYPDTSEISDDFRHLRYLQPYLRAVFLRTG